MKILKNIEQGTSEWHDARRMKVSGTKLKRVMGSALDRVMLIAELMAEEGTEQSKMMRATPEMERGIAEEEFAIQLFEKQTKKKVDRVGMCVSDKRDWLTLSPDGLIADKKGKYTEAVEVKSPDSKTMMFYKMANLIPESDLCLTKSKKSIMGVPADYIWQVVHYFIINKDLQKLHFATFDPRFIDDKQKLYIVEVNRTNKVLQDLIDDAEFALRTFRDKWMEWKEIVMPIGF